MLGCDVGVELRASTRLGWGYGHTVDRGVDLVNLQGFYVDKRSFLLFQNILERFSMWNLCLILILIISLLLHIMVLIFPVRALLRTNVKRSHVSLVYEILLLLFEAFPLLLSK